MKSHKHTMDFSSYIFYFHHSNICRRTQCILCGFRATCWRF